MSSPTASYLKILAFAYSGRGKTYFLVGLLEAGLRIYVAETDIGGSGMSTVREELRRRGKEHLMTNIVSKVFGSYEDFDQFVSDPAGEPIALEDGTVRGLFDWGPDMLAWEGFSNFQNRHMVDYILKYDARGKEDKISDLRQNGLSLEGYGDFSAVLTLTTRQLDKFLLIQDPVTGKKIHKYVTAQSDDGKTEDQLTGETKRGPLVMGRSRSYVAGAFDLILEMEAKKVGADVKYTYRCDVTGNSMAKRRGLDVSPVEDADSYKLWNKIWRPVTTSPVEVK